MLKFVHFNDEVTELFPKGKKFTIGYTINGNFVEFAVAACSKKDQYCRKTGRELVTKRYNNFAFWVLPKLRNERDTVTMLVRLVKAAPKQFALKSDSIL